MGPLSTKVEGPKGETDTQDREIGRQTETDRQTDKNTDCVFKLDSWDSISAH